MYLFSGNQPATPACFPTHATKKTCLVQLSCCPLVVQWKKTLTPTLRAPNCKHSDENLRATRILSPSIGWEPVWTPTAEIDWEPLLRIITSSVGASDYQSAKTNHMELGCQTLVQESFVSSSDCLRACYYQVDIYSSSDRLQVSAIHFLAWVCEISRPPIWRLWPRHRCGGCLSP